MTKPIMVVKIPCELLCVIKVKGFFINNQPSRHQCPGQMKTGKLFLDHEYCLPSRTFPENENNHTKIDTPNAIHNAPITSFAPPNPMRGDMRGFGLPES